jgi:hypothetical protein
VSVRIKGLARARREDFERHEERRNRKCNKMMKIRALGAEVS